MGTDPFGRIPGGPTRSKKVIFFFQAIQTFCPLLLVLLILTGNIHVWMIIGLSLIVVITDALSMPAFQSIVPSIVEPNQIGTAIALNSTKFNLSRVLGPAIAGVVMARYGTCLALWDERTVLHSLAAYGLMDSPAAQD